MGKLNYLQDKNLNNAMVYLDQSLNINNLNAEAYYYKGKIYRDQNDTLQAAQMFRQAIGIKPQFAQSYQELVDMYASATRFDLGLPYAIAGTKHCPDNATLQYQAGWMLSNLGRESEAMLWYQKAYKTDPSIWRASYQLGMYQLKQREYQAASQFLKEALRYKPDIERVSFILGAINEYQFRNYEEALQHYEKAVALEPQNEELQDAVSRMKRRIAYEEYKKSPQYILDQMRKRQQEEAEKLIQGNSGAENN
jgi:tetratricopeptide (TPR) repeat protein